MLQKLKMKLTEQEIEELAIQSALNMGASDTIVFPDMTAEEFIEMDKALRKQIANKAMDELAKEPKHLFSPKQEEFIKNFLDENKDLMDYLVKSGD